MNAPMAQVDIPVDQIDRRMKLLEMAMGDLKRAIELERWVLTGLPPGVITGEMWGQRATNKGTDYA